MKKYFLLFIIVTTSALNCSNNSKRKNVLTLQCNQNPLTQQFLKKSMTKLEDPNYHTDSIAFYNAVRKHSHTTYGESNIATLNFLRNFMIIIPSYLALSLFYSNESSINASTILATLNGAKAWYNYYKFAKKNHRRIINYCANNLNPEYLQLLEQYYKENPNYYSEIVLAQILNHPAMKKRIQQIIQIKQDISEFKNKKRKK